MRIVRRPYLTTLAGAFAIFALGCGGADDAASGDAEAVAEPPAAAVGAEFAESLGIDLASMTEKPSGLYYVDIEEGRGLAAQPGHVVVIEFTGWLPNGVKFDSSEDRGSPEEFPIGARRVIVGKEEAVEGMRIGGIRKVVIPPALGYGSRGRGEIPPNANLVYEIELTEIKM